MIVLRKNWSGQLIFLGPVSDPGVAPHTGRNVTRSRPEGVEPSGLALKHDLFARPTLPKPPRGVCLYKHSLVTITVRTFWGWQLRFRVKVRIILHLVKIRVKPPVVMVWVGLHYVTLSKHVVPAGCQPEARWKCCHHSGIRVMDLTHVSYGHNHTCLTSKSTPEYENPTAWVCGEFTLETEDVLQLHQIACRGSKRGDQSRTVGNISHTGLFYTAEPRNRDKLPVNGKKNDVSSACLNFSDVDRCFKHA